MVWHNMVWYDVQYSIKIWRGRYSMTQQGMDDMVGYGLGMAGYCILQFGMGDMVYNGTVFYVWHEVPGVPKKTGHCLISCNVKAIKDIAMK